MVLNNKINFQMKYFLSFVHDSTEVVVGGNPLYMNASVSDSCNTSTCNGALPTHGNVHIIQLWLDRTE